MTVVNIVNVGRKQEFRVLRLAGRQSGRHPLHATMAKRESTKQARDYSAGSETLATAVVFTRKICVSSVKKWR